MNQNSFPTQSSDGSAFGRLLLVPFVLGVCVFALTASAQQTVTLQPLMPKIVTGANFTQTNAYMLPIAVTFAGGNDPVNLSVPVLPLGVTASFSTNGITNSQTVFLFVNVAGVVKGVYPLTITASDGAVATTIIDLIAGQLWSASNLATANWSAATNWSSGLPTGLGDHVKFEDVGVRTNVVDTSVTIDSITYGRFLSGTNQTTVIPTGNTLSVVGTGGFSASVEAQPGSNKTTTITISGGGALVVSNQSANFTVNALNGGNNGTTLDMSGLSNFSATVSRFGIGDVTLAQAGSVGAQLVVVSLARTNVIRAGFAEPYTGLRITNSIQIFHNGQDFNNGSANTFNLGVVNQFFADSIGMARARVGAANNTVRFNPSFLNSSPSAVFRNTSGGRMTLFGITVDDGDNAPGSNSRLTANFNGGVLDLLANEMWIGRNRFTNTAAARAEGLLTFNNGTVDVNTVRLGYQAYTNDMNARGIVFVGGPGVLVVNNELELGYTSGDYTAGSAAMGFGQLSVTNGGIVRANRIVVGKASLNNTITLTGGTLILSNNLASQAQRLATLTMSGNGRLVLPAISTGNTNAHVKSLLASAGVVEIQSVPGPGVYPIISYESAAPTLSLVLPAGFYGIVKDNTANKTIDAVISTNPPKTVVWVGNVNGNWNTTTKNWVLAGTSTSTNFDDGDFVIFDDSATGTTSISIVGSVFPGQSALTPGTTVSNNTVAYTITSGAISGTGRTLKLGGALFSFGGTHNTALIISNGAVNFSGSSVLNGGLTFVGVAGTNAGTINNPVALLSGTFVNNGTISTAPGFLTTGTGTMIVNGASGTINAGGGTWSVVAGATLWNYNMINNLLGRLNVAGTLAGPGIIADADFGGPVDGRVAIQNGGFVMPGASIGTMEIQGRLDIDAGSRAIIEIDYNHASVNDLIKVDTMGNINGTFVMTNIGAVPFTVGQSNIVIRSTFAGLIITNANPAHIPVVSPTVPGVGKQWDVSLMRITNEVRAIRIVAAPTTPPTFTNTFGGRTNISMTWPTTHLGWQVNQQTNNLHLGISTNAVDWINIPGTELTNRFNITPLTNSAGFFRLSIE